MVALSAFVHAAHVAAGHTATQRPASSPGRAVRMATVRLSVRLPPPSWAPDARKGWARTTMAWALRSAVRALRVCAAAGVFSGLPRARNRSQNLASCRTYLDARTARGPRGADAISKWLCAPIAISASSRGARRSAGLDSRTNCGLFSALKT